MNITIIKVTHIMYDKNLEFNILDCKLNNSFVIDKYQLCQEVCNDIIIELRKFEYNNEDITEDSYELFLKKLSLCFTLIIRIGKTLAESIIYNNNNNIFEELNDRFIYYYKYMNDNSKMNINNIKVVTVFKHDQAVPYIFRSVTEELPSLLTFDNHADIECMSLCNFNNINDIQNSNSNMGAVHVPIMAKYKKNNGVFWIKPEWLNVHNFNDTVYTVNDGVNVILKLNYKPEYHLYSETIFKVLNISEMYDEKVTDNYILNIDLDYFVSNGTTHDSYMNFPSIYFDIQSNKRTSIDFDFMKDEIYRANKVDELENEIDLIRNRIDLFIQYIAFLKSQHKTPSLIILCDSTSTFGSSTYLNCDKQCDNGFVPKYLSLWLKNTVYKHLKSILET